MSRQLVVMKQGEGETLSVLGTQVKFLCCGDKTDHAWSIMEVVLPKHAGPPPHDHAWDEAYYVTRGQVRFRLAEREQIIAAGDFLYAPGGTLHGFQGDSEEPAHMLIIDAPAHAEAFFRDVDREVKGPDDRAKVPEIGRRNQIFFRPA
ncbi:cupin domain-containing protein [Noviherbaspirillum aerium]|uniref:cupin domain-containing protein n=1 Tax=Noviherbaspirillum aerium TaxID=2588497 RepID=UPI00124F747F|nr:cupin domain-containing protein [Noviherbaspirillum aerium]